LTRRAYEVLSDCQIVGSRDPKNCFLKPLLPTFILPSMLYFPYKYIHMDSSIPCLFTLVLACDYRKEKVRSC